MLLSILRSNPAVVAVAPAPGDIEPVVTANGVVLDRVVVTSCTWPTGAEQAATVEVSLVPASSGVSELFANGAPLKGPYSPEWRISWVGPDGDLIRFEGFTNAFQYKPGTGKCTFQLVGSTGHKAIVSEPRTNIVPPLSEWELINAESTSGPSANGDGVLIEALPNFELVDGELVENVFHGLYVAVDLGTSAKPYTANFNGWAYWPKESKGVGQFRFALENMETHHVTQDAIAMDSLPRDKVERLSPWSKAIPATHHYVMHLGLFTPIFNAGAMGFSDVRGYVDLQIGVASGSTAVDLAAVMWMEQFANTSTPWGVSSAGGSSTAYATGQWFSVRERFDPRSNIPGDTEWVAYPNERQLVVGGVGAIGITHDNVLAGWPPGGCQFVTDDVQSGTDDMATRAWSIAPWGDACNEEAVAEVSAPRPWGKTTTEQTGVLPSALPGLAEAELVKSARGKSTAYTNTAVVPLTGTSPISWWGTLQPGDRILNRVTEGPIDLGDVQRITQLEANFATQTLTVTVASEDA